MNVATSGSDGFFGADSISASNCAASGNTGVGFNLGNGARLEGCLARANHNDGIYVGDGSHVAHCSAFFCDGDGIKVTYHCVVLENLASDNGTLSTDAGVHAIFNGNRIESNHITDNVGYGIFVEGTGNLVLKNSARKSTVANYKIVAANKVATIKLPADSPAISGDTGGGVLSTDPNANLAY